MSDAPDASGINRRTLMTNQIDLARAVAAIVLGVAFIIAVGGDVPTASSVLPLLAAAIVTAYPVIDVVSSILGAPSAGSAGRALYFNAVISAVAAVGIGVAAFGSDAGATLLAFGIWAVVSGAIQFVLAFRRRRAEGGQLLMLISGGLSTLAGLSFVAASGQSEVNLGTLSVYMIVGAILFIASSRWRAA
ncbi:MAG: DUF308 domain-containing protein [Actinomycetota bacterium]